MDKVIIGVASGSSVITQFAMSLADLAAYVSPNYEYCGIINVTGVLIDDARNNIVNQFLTTEADWLLMIDTDLAFNADILDRYIEMFRHTKAKVGAGWFNVRKQHGNWITPRPTIYNFLDDDLATIPIFDKYTPEYFTADACASGALMVHRDVFQQLKDNGVEHFFKFTHNKYGTTSEDIHFCRLLKERSIPLIIGRDISYLHYKVLPL